MTDTAIYCFFIGTGDRKSIEELEYVLNSEAQGSVEIIEPEYSLVDSHDAEITICDDSHPLKTRSKDFVVEENLNRLKKEFPNVEFKIDWRR